MKTLKIIAALFILAAIALAIGALTGCAHYSNVRTVTDPDSKVTKYERTSVTTLFVKAEASGIQSKTKDGDYTRDVKVGAVTNQGDPQTVEALGTAIGNGIKAASGTGLPGL